jgi:hypothetical protein
MSEYHQIPNFPKYLIDFNGNVYSQRTNKILKSWDGEGYDKISLRKDGKTHKLFIHRLLGIVFIPNPLNLPTINHKNGNRKDNRVENLEWSSYTDQELHKSKVVNARKRGATFAKNGWLSTISIAGKQKYLGRFTTKEEAQNKYFEEYVKTRGVPPW